MSSNYLRTLETIKGFTIVKLGKALHLSDESCSAYQAEYKANPSSEARTVIVEKMLKDTGERITAGIHLTIAEALAPKGKVRETALALAGAYMEDELNIYHPVPASSIPKKEKAPREKGSNSPLHGDPKPQRASVAGFLKS